MVADQNVRTPRTAQPTPDERRQSQALVGIVSVIYGVAIAISLTAIPAVLLHPWSDHHLMTTLAVAAAVVLSIYGFFSYVLAVGRDEYSYRLLWQRGKDLAETKRDARRFVIDVILAGAYVRLLLGATEVTASSVRSTVRPPSVPTVAAFVSGFAIVFGLVCIVRVARYGPTMNSDQHDLG